MKHPDPNEARASSSRRHLLGGALAWPAALAIGHGPRARLAKPAQGAGALAETPRDQDSEAPADDLEALFARWIPRARALVREERPHEDAFLYELCADIVRREASFFPGRRFTVYSGEGMQTGPLGRDDVFQLIEVVLEPGAVVPAHNHVAYAFVTLCLEGEARVRHFEPEPGSPGPLELEKDFHVREVQNVLLRPGRCSTLSRTRANVHTITAGPEGARLLDFAIKFPAKGDGPGVFSALEVVDDDAERGVYSARWIGNIYAKGYERKK